MTVGLDFATNLPLAFGQSLRPFQHTIWGQPLPDNAAIDPNSATAVAQIVAQAAKATPTDNTTAWTLEPQIVPADQPLVPVAWHGGATEFELQAILKLGVPIPTGFRPTSDSDASASFWQPGYRHPTDSTICGRLFELYGVRVTENPDGTLAYSASFGTRLYNVNDTSRPRQYSNQVPKDYATNPDSLFCRPSWGVQGSGLPYSPGVLTLADCQRGHVDHALLLEVVDARAGGFVWPALKDDGDSHVGTFPVKEGQRYRFPADYPVDSKLHPLARLQVQALRDYGCVVTDRSSCLAFRIAPSAKPYLGSSASWQVLNGFPWADLQLLAVGSDSTPTPVGHGSVGGAG